MIRALDVLVVLLAASLLLVFAIGGIDYQWGVLRLRLHDWIRPLVLLVLALGVRTWLTRRAPAFALRATAGKPFALRATAGRPLAPHAAVYIATRSLLALLLAIAAVYAHHHVRVAGGLDSHGYASAASLLRAGRLTEPQPLVSLLPFENASTAAAPLGYVPGLDGRTSVPRFPLGLPIMMALFSIFGPDGRFFVPLVMAYATMGLGFLMGREPNVPASGLFVAVLVAVDPLMVDYGIQPMSDVPATCWLIAALWLRLERPAWPIAAGFCAGMAILTRPVLLPAVIVLGLVTAAKRRSTLRFGAVVLVFVVLQMMLNWKLYGGVGSSGYGPASHMFEPSFSRLGANVSNFGKWLTYSHTPLIWGLWPAALVILRRRRWAWQVSAVAAAAAVPYLFYLVFNDWESSRFLLPTIVLVLIMFARAISVLIGATRASGLPAIGATAMILIAFMCAAASHRFLEREAVYAFAGTEAKYPLVGNWFRTRTSDRGVVLAGLHSGSIRFYSHRETIRWDQIPSGKLGPTLRNLVAAGYEPYLALDVGSEPPLFAERFKSEPSIQTEQIARVRVVNIYRFVSVH